MLQTVKRSPKPAVGKLVPFWIPHKGIDARSSLVSMEPLYAVGLRNVLPEPYGMRTRKGYTEWAMNIPGAGGCDSVLSYLPANAGPTILLGDIPQLDVSLSLWANPPSKAAAPPGKLFVSKFNLLYDVTAGGAGPWVAEADMLGATNYWNGLMMQNIAGAFLAVCNEGGGYSYYDGAIWKTPIMGAAAGEIAGVNPNTFCQVSQYKKRLWFVEKDSTSAWYLAVDSLTGAATKFNFGEQFAHGGFLVSITNWTVEGGDGMDDHLIAISSQGDVVIYKGLDPSSATTFELHGRWYIGPLPVGRRQVWSSGSEVYILSQFGLMALSRVLSSTSLAVSEQNHVSYLVDPFIARLMQDYSLFQGWQIVALAKEELIVIGIPKEAATFGGMFLAYKVTTKGWAFLTDTGYANLVNIGPVIYAGTVDGRCVRAFDGPLDNVLLGTTVTTGFSSAFSSAFGGPLVASEGGVTINCQVIPAYQLLGEPGNFKRIMMVRPSFTAKNLPSVKVQVLTDYGAPAIPQYPTLVASDLSKWGSALWDIGKWVGILAPIRNWIGVSGQGFAATVQLDYTCGGDSVLTNIDFWVEEGGPL